MNAEDIVSTIVASTFTTVDLHRRLRLLREYLEKKYFASQPSLTIEAFLKAQDDVSESEKDMFLSFGDDFYGSFTKDTCYKLLDMVAAKAKAMPTVRLNLSFDPPPGEVQKIGLWFRQNLPVNVLLDIKIDADALGGCTFAWNGIFRDYSLGYYVQKNTSDIVQLLNSYSGSKNSTASRAGEAQTIKNGG